MSALTEFRMQVPATICLSVRLDAAGLTDGLAEQVAKAKTLELLREQLAFLDGIELNLNDSIEDLGAVAYVSTDALKADDVEILDVEVHEDEDET